MEQEKQEQQESKGDIKRNRIDEAVRRRNMRRVFIAGGVLAGIGLIGGLIVYAGRHKEAEPAGVMTYANQGQDHVPLDHQFTYNSNPPTSGPHYATPANWGVYDYEANDKIFIHNLEHGGIWISYRPGISPQVVEDLKAVVNEFGGSKIVMAPRSANDADIAVAAWTHLVKIDHVGQMLTDEEKDRIRSFYRAYKNRGPEFVPDMMPGIDPKSVQ